jgi:hypothetical protein
MLKIPPKPTDHPSQPQARLLDSLLLLLSSPLGCAALLADTPAPPALARVCLAALDRCNGLEDAGGDEEGGGGGGLDAALLDRLLRVSGSVDLSGKVSYAGPPVFNTPQPLPQPPQPPRPRIRSSWRCCAATAPPPRRAPPRPRRTRWWATAWRPARCTRSRRPSRCLTGQRWGLLCAFALCGCVWVCDTVLKGASAQCAACTV